PEPGYVIDEGPRNETLGDAGRGVSRRDADRAGRHLLADQPRCLAPCGVGADPRRDRTRSRHQGRPAGAALRVDVLTANLRLLPLLLQRFEIADVMILRPQIRVVRAADGVTNWTPFIQTIARTMKPGAESQMSFSEIGIQDGILSYQDDANHTLEKLDDIDLSLAWPSISRSFAATGQ